MKLAPDRHRWGQPHRLPHKTERLCAKCALVKVTRHESEAGRDKYWTEYFRGLDQINCDATPPCDPEAMAT